MEFRMLATFYLALFQPILGFYLVPYMQLPYVKRSSDATEDCIQMKNTPGDFLYVSSGTENVCALLLIGSPDEIISLSFLEFNVDCLSGGLLQFIDGWENQGQVFPSDEDYPYDISERYQLFCGDQQPTEFLSSQNVAMLQFKIPTRGQGFLVRINLVKNLTPCNVVSTQSEGFFTIDNPGEQRNCSVLIVYPEKLEILQMNIGKKSKKQLARSISTFGKIGIFHEFNQCRNRKDYLEIAGGSGLESSEMHRFLKVCGSITRPGTGTQRSTVMAVCPYTVVRLVSSGQFFNTVVIRFEPITELIDTNSDDSVCGPSLE